MKQYIVRLASGEYVSECRIVSSYLDFKRTSDRESATRFNDFDSQLVIKRLSQIGEKAEREEAVEFLR